jgi:imidazole glycerol-phosphate synthase subunit HisF
LVSDIATAVGTQSVIVVLDVKKKLFGGYEVYTHNGKKSTGKSPTELAKQFEALGAGEIVINNIDNDGVMKGFDLLLAEKIREVTTVPMTILGGAGTLDDIKQVIQKFGIIGVAAGSLFVFKGIYRAVLISYPSIEEKYKLFKK